MLALVCTLVFAAAATFAVAAIFVTMQGRKAQITALLAEYRSLERDREFLVQITGPAGGRVAAWPQLRRTARRLFRQAEAVRSSQPQRAVA